MSFLRALFAATILTCLAWMPAAAQTPASILQDFDFFGQWAQDCQVLTSNARKVVPLPDGKVEMRSAVGAGENVYVVLEARRVGPNEVWVKTKLGGQTDIELNIVREGGRLRTMNGRETNGPYFTQNGIVLSTGKPTPWLQRCQARRS